VVNLFKFPLLYKMYMLPESLYNLFEQRDTITKATQKEHIFAEKNRNTFYV